MPLRHHRSNHGVAEVENAAEVGVDHRFPLVEIHHCQQVVTNDPGVVAQRCRSVPSSRTFRRPFFADSGSERGPWFAFYLSLAQLGVLDQLVGRLGARAIDEGDLGPFASQLPDDPPPFPAAAAGPQGFFPANFMGRAFCGSFGRSIVVGGLPLRGFVSVDFFFGHLGSGCQIWLKSSLM
ncbi:MAG: hypothetical protein Ct9H300mP1_10760 [Planctomycetaceae bacterium]|nr:MAG: hypothetical protein Ct9H300mP1_10760 [Planctomycetaceae bacterium]